jgi:hypothetical protein
MPYPVVTEAVLPRAGRTWYGRRRREPTDLPAARAGCGYVLETRGEYVNYGERPLDTADAAVVAATAISLVDTRSRLLAIDITIPSALPDEDFTVRSTFRCHVVDPAAAARAGLTDLDVVLASHLASDDQLGSVGRAFHVGRAHDVRQLADARVRALCIRRPYPASR